MDFTLALGPHNDMAKSPTTNIELLTAGIKYCMSKNLKFFFMIFNSTRVTHLLLRKRNIKHWFYGGKKAQNNSKLRKKESLDLSFIKDIPSKV